MIPISRNSVVLQVVLESLYKKKSHLTKDTVIHGVRPHLLHSISKTICIHIFSLINERFISRTHFFLEANNMHTSFPCVPSCTRVSKIPLHDLSICQPENES